MYMKNYSVNSDWKSSTENTANYNQYSEHIELCLKDFAFWLDSL